MTKKELIRLLEGLPDNMQIVMSSDSEGNSYGPLSGGWLGVYVPSTREMYQDAQKPESGYGPEDYRTPGEGGAVLAFVLYPI